VIRQGSLGDVAEMMAVSPAVLDYARTYGVAERALASSALREREAKASLLQMPKAGDVVVIDKTGGIKLSESANSTSVIGVISTSPAHILRGELPNSVPVALSGTVPCKVTSENGPIYPGELLTSSSKPGYAMKASPAMIGTIVGKAMETLEQGEGEIMVFVTRQ